MTKRNDRQIKAAHVTGRYVLLAAIVGFCGMLAAAFIHRQANPDVRPPVVENHQGDRPKDAAERNIPPRHIR